MEHLWTPMSYHSRTLPEEHRVAAPKMQWPNSFDFWTIETSLPRGGWAQSFVIIYPDISTRHHSFFATEIRQLNLWWMVDPAMLET